MVKGVFVCIDGFNVCLEIISIIEVKNVFNFC